MLSFVTSVLLPAVVRHAFEWLGNRALVIPQKDLQDFANLLGVPVEKVQDAQRTWVQQHIAHAEQYVEEHLKF